MAELSKEQVYELAKVAGIELDDQRADLIAARLGAVLDDLDGIDDEALSRVEPALTFKVQRENAGG